MCANQLPSLEENIYIKLRLIKHRLGKMDLLAIIGFVFVMYILIYLIVPWFLDCDIYLAFNTKFGKTINSLKGKVVWITGASSGIGEELAYVLSQAGCKLVISARREAELERVKLKCLEGNKELQNEDIELLVLDVCQIDAHDQAFKHIINKFGKLDILVNNAGRSQRAQWEKIAIEVDKEMFELNVFSAISLSRLVANYFLKVGAGHLVVTSSIAGICAVPFSATYCATKHALHGYFGSWKLEKLGEKIPVTMVCAGPVQTNILQECFTDTPGEKYGTPTAISKTKLQPRRCAQLAAVGIANEISEVWIAKPAVLLFTYLAKYCPNLFTVVSRIVDKKYIARLRDAKAAEDQNW